jgi:hypothetical protein
MFQRLKSLRLDCKSNAAEVYGTQKENCRNALQPNDYYQEIPNNIAFVFASGHLVYLCDAQLQVFIFEVGLTACGTRATYSLQLVL